MASQSARFVVGTEQAATLKFGDEVARDGFQIGRYRTGPQPEAGDTGIGQFGESIGEGLGGSGEHLCVTCVLDARSIVEPRSVCFSCGCRVTEEDHEVGEHVDDLVGAAGLVLRRTDGGDARLGVGDVGRGDETDVRGRSDELIRDVLVRKGGDDGLTLRWSRRDGRSSHREEPAFEVDVVQFVAVDEASGGLVADLGVVFPTVPEPSENLCVVACLLEEVGHQLGGHRVAGIGDRELRERAPAEQGSLVWSRRYLHPDAGPAVADVVEGRDRFRQMERLGMGDGGGRNQPDMPRQR